MVAVARRRNRADRKGSRLQRGAEPGVGKARLSLPSAPGVEVVRAFCRREARALGLLNETEQGLRIELLVRCVIADPRHGMWSRISRPAAVSTCMPKRL